MYVVELLFMPCLVNVLIRRTCFFYVCDEFTPKSHRMSITPILKKKYELCVGCKVGTQDELGTTVMLQHMLNMTIPYQFPSHLNIGPCLKKNQPTPLQKTNLEFRVPIWILISWKELYFILYRNLNLIMMENVWRLCCFFLWMGQRSKRQTFQS